MDDILLLEAIERYLSGDMSAEEVVASVRAAAETAK